MPWRLLLGLHRAAAEWDVGMWPGRIHQKVKADPPPHLTADLFRIPSSSLLQGSRAGTAAPHRRGSLQMQMKPQQVLLQHYFSLTINQHKHKHKAKFQRNEQNQNFHSEDRRSRLKSLTQFSETSSFQFRQIPLLQIVCYYVG